MHTLIFLMMGVVFFGCTKKSQEGTISKPGIVAEINDESLTSEQFNRRYQWYVNRFKFKVSKKEFLNNLVNLELASQEALKQKINDDEKLLYDYKVLLSQHLLEKEVYAKFKDIKTTDRDLETYFETFPEIRASHILFKIDEKTDPKKEEEIKAKALQVLKKAKAHENFEKLAKQYSDGPSAKNGGDLDYFSRESMVKEFSDVAYSLKQVGDISDLVKTRYGYHIIKLTGRKKFKDADKRQLRNQLLSRKQKELYDGFFESLKKKATVKTNEELIAE